MNILDDFKKIGRYKMSKMCLSTYPCQHSIKFENGDTKLMSGGDIYRLFKLEGLYDPHIDSYAEWVRQQDFPSPEEIQMRKNNELSIQQAYEKATQAAAEQQHIINQYKASSRLDRLKNKHNIK